LQVPEHRLRRDPHSRSDFCDGQPFLAERPCAFGTYLEGAKLPPPVPSLLFRGLDPGSVPRTPVLALDFRQA